MKTWANVSRSGYGDSDGYSYGYGYGDGHSYGYGYGDGYGDGNGDGNNYGNGCGDGYGFPPSWLIVGDHFANLAVEALV